MKKLLLGLLIALASIPAFADRVATGPGYAVTARTTACPATVLKHVRPEFHNIFHKADVLVDGKPFVGCWTVQDGVVFFIFEDGTMGTLLESDFRELKNV